MAPRKPDKTLAMRVLEGRDIPYQPVHYVVERHLSASEVSGLLGLPPDEVFKTLVVLPDDGSGRPVLALIPSESSLDLKKLATAIGDRKLRMASQRDAEGLTGLKKGCISPLALMARNFRLVFDETVAMHDRIELSAGKVGVGVLVPVHALLDLLQPLLADITA